MEIRVTVYLKSGGELASTYYEEKVQYTTERFANIFTDKEPKAVCINAGKNIHIIPRDNVAAISISEVSR